MSNVILKKPVGWWVSYKKDRWDGPFASREEAIETAHHLVPARYTEFTLLQVAAWDEKVIKLSGEPT